MSKEIADIVARLDEVIRIDLPAAAATAVAHGPAGAAAIGLIQDNLKSIRLALRQVEISNATKEPDAEVSAATPAF